LLVLLTALLAVCISLATFMLNLIHRAGVALIVSGIVLVALVLVTVAAYHQRALFRKRWESKAWRRGTFVVAGAVLVSTIIAAVILSTPTPPITGTISYPGNDSTIHLNKGYFSIGGTVKNLPSGYRLLLFLEWANQNKFLGGNPYIIVNRGHWSGHKLLYVGAAPSTIIVWLVAQGPKTIAFMNSPRGEQLWSPPGFPSLHIASDSVILRSIELHVA
jgi:hypothetical protein